MLQLDKTQQAWGNDMEMENQNEDGDEGELLLAGERCKIKKNTHDTRDFDVCR